jgi:hypothetical protein
MAAEVITDTPPTLAAEASDPAGGKPGMRAPDRVGTTGAPIAAAGTIAAMAANGGAKAGSETGAITVAASDRGILDVRARVGPVGATEQRPAQSPPGSASKS